MNNKDGGRIIIDLPTDLSDGDPMYWPTDPAYKYQPNDRLYHQKLADYHMGNGNLLGGMYFSVLFLKIRVSPVLRILWPAP
jgi:hypothetical protein